MIDAQKLVAFALVTATTSIVPGPSMLFITNQAIWRGKASGWAALWGLQLGYLAWWILAAVGLGSIAARFPAAFLLLAVGGALYLAWLGLQAWRHAGEGDRLATGQPSRRAFRDGAMVAIGNPKSLIYMVAIIPPFIDPASAIVPQIAILALVALVIDLAVGMVYIGAGRSLASAMQQPHRRLLLDRATGLIFLGIGAIVLIETFIEIA